jgi:hypothetical protein
VLLFTSPTLLDNHVRQAGATLLDLGYQTVVNAGGVDELVDAGLEFEPFAPPSG